MNPQFTSGEMVTAAKMNQLPKGVLGYAETTTGQSTITTAVDITGLSVAVTVVAGRRLSVVVYSPSITGSVLGDRFSCQILEGATQLQQGIRRIIAAANAEEGFRVQAILTPSAGAHTYKVNVARVAGTGNLSWNAGATNPSFILVEDIGGTA